MTEQVRGLALRWLPWLLAAALVIAAIPVGLARGAPSVVLLAAFGALGSAVYFFWESLRLVADSRAPGDALVEGHEEGLPAELVARKRAAMRGLQDIDFEHSIGRLGDADHEKLRKQYRDEARAALQAIEQSLGSYLSKANALVSKVEKSDKAEPAAAREAPVERASAKPARGRACAGCGTRNDADAVFCKKCGARIGEASDG